MYQILAARLVLEVFGGAGAIWGFSEAVTFRNNNTVEFWRLVALIVGVLFLIRWMMQMLDYIFGKTKYYKVVAGYSLHSNQCIRLFQMFSTRLVLEVFGGAGAIWGFSEVLTLRNPDTLWFWRPASLAIGTIFFCRWLFQIHDCIMEFDNENNNNYCNNINMNGCSSIYKKSMSECDDQVEEKMDMESLELQLKVEYGTAD